MRHLLAICCLALLPAPAFAQHAMPAPAPYFQQEVNYTIDVALDDRKHELTGHEQVQYTNNSPQALTFIWFHLWPNAYRDNRTAFARQQLRNGNRAFAFAPAAQRGFIDGLAFTVDGQAATLEFDPNNPDVAKLLLPRPLAAGATAAISTPFRVKLPGPFSRMRHVGQNYQITQWYPKPAVLDRRGWHPMPYLDQGEFYSEFGSFDVRITLPANYTVGATGELQNPDEIARLEGLAAETAKKTTQADFGDDLTFPASATATKTLRYKQDRVHDFAWFADKRFNVLKSAVTLPSGRAVTSWVLFTNREATRWIKGLQDVNEALMRYSKWVGEYPYSSATAVQAGVGPGSMEYPMVTVCIPEALVHEVGHNWFYGILGSNERDFAWMDEGVNTYFEKRLAALDSIKSTPFGGSSITDRAIRSQVEGLPPAALKQVAYQVLASRGLDQPVQGLTSAEFGKRNYELMTYHKTASLLHYLAGYLGQERFDRALQAYYERWKFRHPYPEDMQASFEESTGQPLGWFFNDLLTGTHHYNAYLSAPLAVEDGVQVQVRTDSPVPWAVPVSSLDANGKVLETRWTPPFGRAGAEAASPLSFRRAGVASLVVDAGYLTPQLNRRDDRLQLTSPAPSLEPLRLRPLASVERWDQAAINWLPALGANTSDKLMLGAAFYNSLLAPKRLQYLAMPLYSFARKEVNGIASLQLNLLPASKARTVTVGATVQRFERYLKLEPSVSVVLPHSAFNGPQHRLTLSGTAVNTQDRLRNLNIVTADYRGRIRNALREWNWQVDLNRMRARSNEAGNDAPAFLLRGAVSLQQFYSPTKRVQVRLFGGSFLQTRENRDFFLGLSGSPDYRRQTVFLDRPQISRTLAAQHHQTDDRDGAFKAFMPVFTNNWLTTVNLQVDVPVVPVAVFADFGATREPFVVGGRSRNTYYDAGLAVPLLEFAVPMLKDVLQIYLPVAGTQYENFLPSSRKDFTDRIRFVLRLDRLSPFRLLDEQLAQ
jgi:hypothetical protein